MRTTALVTFALSLLNLSSAYKLSLDVALPQPPAAMTRRVSPEIAQIITTKKLQYCRFADTHQWSGFEQVAFPECTYQYTDHGELIVEKGFRYEWNSTAAFTGFFSMAFQTLQTMHHVGPGEFSYVNDDEILAIFPIVYHSALAKNATSTQGVTGTGGGHYHETYKRKGDDWLMIKCTMDRIYEISQ